MKIITLFELYHQKALAYNGNRSIREQAGHIKSLLRCFEPLNINDTSDLTLANGLEIIKWYRTNTENSNNSINKRLSFLKSALTYCDVETEFKKLKYLKSDTKPYQKLYDNQVNIILKSIDDLTHMASYGENMTMYQLMIYMMLDTGMRIGELLEIEKRNIDLDNFVILLEVTKNKKKEPIPFSSFSSDLLKNILNLNLPGEYLFWNISKNRVMTYENDVKNFMRRFKIKTGINVHAHRFRKTYGTKIYQVTTDLRLVQKLLRHAKSSTTEIYIQEGIEEVHQRYQVASNVFKQYKIS